MKSRMPRERRSIVALLHNEVTAWLVLAISLAITALGWYVSDSYVARRTSDRFSFEVSDAVQRIRNRMLEYEQVLRSGWPSSMPWSVPRRVPNGALSSSGCGFRGTFPGIQGIGYAQMLAPETPAPHIASVRAEGFDTYTVKPGENATFTVRSSISALRLAKSPRLRLRHVLEPDAPRSHGPRARYGRGGGVRQGRAGPGNLGGRAGRILVYLPVYRPDTPTDTVARRREALIGFVLRSIPHERPDARHSRQ